MISRIAGHWNAILLLDEADVFLERRSSHEITRNGLISIFLRKLEYCEGIMFLTTNRMSEFDEAILTRVHLMLRFDELDIKSRRSIWNTFLNRANTPKGPADIKPSKLNRLVEVKLNGRQVCTLYTLLKVFLTVY
jgi:SpoVK/Ycf46/Vps4 family AAA+-type ATPase